MKHPNLVLFVPDEWRGDVLGHVGHKAASTPVLDRLVSTDAVSFTSTFCQNPVSTPSRCSFMSGWYPHVRGHRTMYHMLRDDEPNVLRTLKQAGYQVWWGGKNDLTPAQNASERLVDVRYRPEREAELSVPSIGDWRGAIGDRRFYSFYQGRLSDVDESWIDKDIATIHAALAWIASRPDDGPPWAVYLSLIHPHPPYGVEEPWYSLVPRDALPPRIPTPVSFNKPSILTWIRARQGLSEWSEEEWNELRATYYGMCARLDSLFGKVLDDLRENGMYEDTAIVFFADHGDFAGDYGLVEKTQNTFEDALTRVPLIIKPAARTSFVPGTRDTLVELVDIPITVADLLGIPWPEPGFGRSVMPVLDNPEASHRDAVFSEGGRLHEETQCMELDSKGGATPEGIYWPRLSAQRSEGPEHTKAIMCRTSRYKYVYRHYESDELYDLVDDPMELNNLVEVSRYAPVSMALKERVFRWLVETVDVVPLEPDQRE